MIKIRNKEICTEQEFNSYYDFLLKIPRDPHPVQILKEHINSGAQLSKGLITSIDEIGNLETSWNELAGIHSENRFDIPTFYISQAINILNDPNCIDLNDKKEKLKIINKYLDKLYIQEIDPFGFISLMNNETGLRVYDGNHRVVAYYEYCIKNKLNNINLPVYILED